jgi:hypothetical protein
MAYTRYKGDPWKRAKVDGTSQDGTPYRKGERVFFYPEPARPTQAMPPRALCRI